MNAGLSNFDTLKKHLLAGSTAKTDTRFDTAIQAIGLGTAAAIENFCQRKFFRSGADTQIIGADRCQFLLSRFPLETVTAVDLKLSEADGWEPVDLADIQTIDLKNGIVYFPDTADLGPYYGQVRITFAGGYWWETAEPDDDSYPTAPPAGSNALPSDLQLAWLMQCEVIWSKRDKLGSGLVDDPDAKSKISTLELSPLVKQMLGQFVRYNLV